MDNITELFNRAAALKAATHDAHQTLDKSIMEFNPFQSKDNYKAFLQMQYAFHHDVAPFFQQPQLNVLLPDLAYRGRLQQVQQDLADLQLELPQLKVAPLFAGGEIDIPTALGWLYVEEGSNLGGAFLFKAAAKLGFDSTYGARHLAPHPEGRAPNWKMFVAQLNEIELSAEEEARVVAGAVAAFERVSAYVQTFCRTTPLH